MGNAKAEEPFSEIELPEYEPPRYEPTHGHREEEQTPLVRYCSTSRTLYDPNRGVLSYTKASHPGCRALLAIIIMLAMIIGIPVGVNKYTTNQINAAKNQANRDTTEPHANMSPSNVFSLSPNETYSGDVSSYDGKDIESICPGNSTIPYGVMLGTGFFDTSATRPHSNYTSLCGHKIWVSGFGSNGTSANLTLTVSDRCSQCQTGDIMVDPDVLTVLGGVDGGNVFHGVKVKWHFL